MEFGCSRSATAAARTVIINVKCNCHYGEVFFKETELTSSPMTFYYINIPSWGLFTLNILHILHYIYFTLEWACSQFQELAFDFCFGFDILKPNTQKCDYAPNFVSGNKGSHHSALHRPWKFVGQGERPGPHHRWAHPQVRAVLWSEKELPRPGALVQSGHMLQVGLRWLCETHILTCLCPVFIEETDAQDFYRYKFIRKAKQK